ncbi:MAG TPA: hypothetical protein DCL21_04300 [Alphaproteobacteria bacterium]|nr:hypothetical protein [Alphaproteobacteria bacterium]
MMRKALLTLIAICLISFQSSALDRYTITNLVKELKPAVVTVEQSGTFGTSGVASGVVVSSDGYVVTNYHAVEGAKSLRVKFSNKKVYDATVVNYDEKTDLAVLKIGTYDAFPYVNFANSDSVQVGELVFAIGSPYGLEHSVSMGIISGKNRQTGNYGYEDFLQTDASINPGNSGGPLFNLDGYLIGINTANLTQTGGSNGIGLAIPSNLVKRVIIQLQQKGSVKRATIGVEVADINQEVKQLLGLSSYNGAVVHKLLANSPASNAGVVPGDVIVRLNGQEIRSSGQYNKQMEHSRVGSKVRVGILRNGKVRTIVLHLVQDL